MKDSVASASKTQQKRGRKMREERMQKLMHACHARMPTQVKVVIATWEAELNSKAVNEEVSMEDWEPLLIDPGHTKGRQTLFRQTI